MSQELDRAEPGDFSARWSYNLCAAQGSKSNCCLCNKAEAICLRGDVASLPYSIGLQPTYIQEKGTETPLLMGV